MDLSAVPGTLLAEQAIAQQRVALSLIKQNAQADQAIAGILEQAAQSIAASHRGGTVDIAV